MKITANLLGLCLLILSLVTATQVEARSKSVKTSQTVITKTKGETPSLLDSRVSTYSQATNGHWVWVPEVTVGTTHKVSTQTKTRGPVLVANPVQTQRQASTRYSSSIQSSCPNGQCPQASSRTYRKTKSYSSSRSR